MLGRSPDLEYDKRISHPVRTILFEMWNIFIFFQLYALIKTLDGTKEISLAR